MSLSDCAATVNPVGVIGANEVSIEGRPTSSLANTTRYSSPMLSRQFATRQRLGNLVPRFLANSSSYRPLVTLRSHRKLAADIGAFSRIALRIIKP